MTEQRILYRDMVISGLALLMVYYCLPERWFLIIGGAYLLACVFLQPVKRANHRFWQAFTKLMQSITNPLLYGTIFLVILVPLALLFRLFKKKKPEKDSTFVKVEQKTDVGSFEVPW